MDILEDDIKCTRFKDKEEINEVVGEDETAKVKAEERLKNIKKITAHKEECGLRRSGRGKNSLPWQIHLCKLLSVNVPNTFDEAMSHEDANHWQQAMKEISSLEKKPNLEAGRENTVDLVLCCKCKYAWESSEGVCIVRRWRVCCVIRLCSEANEDHLLQDKRLYWLNR